MDAKDVIQLLRLQRHDLMNDLQIVNGYLSMGKIDKVKAKVDGMIDEFQHERMLMNINCPNFALWVMQVKLHYKHIQLAYDIHTENKNLQEYDASLTNIGNTIIENILADKLEIITVELQLRKTKDGLMLVVTLQEPPIDTNRWKTNMVEKLENVNIRVEELEQSVEFTFLIPAP